MTQVQNPMPVAGAQKNSSRLKALDTLRGLTIAGMICVNNPGSWSAIYAPLKHAAWNGCTPTDLVFPFFIFVMGVAMCLSYNKFQYKLTGKTVGKLLYRSVLLILIGWALNWFGIGCRTLAAGGSFVSAIWTEPIAHLRFMGVFPRLGLVSLLAGLCLLLFKPKRLKWVIGTILLGYCLLIGLTGSFDLSVENIIARVDIAVLGENHMYHMNGIPFDPEGLLSTLPCVAHCLIGVLAGSLILKNERGQAVQKLFILGTALLLTGFLLDYAFPINKSLWSASYVLVTCGLGSLLLALLIWVMDIEGHQKWANFFVSFGVNPLFIFVLANILATLMANIHFTVGGEMYSIWGFWYQRCMMPLFGATGGSLACALSLVLVLWGIAHPLYLKRIYIKL